LHYFSILSIYFQGNNSKKCYCLFIIFLFSTSFNLFSQIKNDSIENSKIKVQNLQNGNNSNSVILKKLNEWLVISKDSGLTERELLSQFEAENQKYNQSIIREIKIKQVSPFAKSILDTINISSSSIGKKLEKYRFETNRNIIKNNLLFKNGEYINLDDIKDSERMIRSLSFIDDALIIIEPASIDTSLVDILVLTQDNYPYGGNIGLIDKNIEVGIYSQNVLGLGLEMNHIISSKLKTNGKPGFSERLRWSNIYGSHISMSLNMDKLANLDQFNTSIVKNFYTQEVKYAGGFALIKNHRVDPTFNTQDILKNNFDYFNQDYWIGRSFLINTTNYFDRSNLGFMGEFKANNYFNLPDSLSSRTDFVENLTLFTSISFSKRDYYKNSLIYNYGRTEDVPHGLLSSVTFGYNYNEIQERYLVGLHFSTGRAIIPNRGYLFFSSDFQSMFYKNKTENIINRMQAQYISPLVNFKNNRLRNFISLYYLQGDKLSTQDYIYLKESTIGLTAYNSKSLKGLKKAVIKTESVLFLPKDLVGFKMACFSFFDIAWITEKDNVFISSPYSVMGIGLRLRNDHLVIKTLQLKLAYFPKLPPGGVDLDFRLSGSEIGRFNDFNIKKPYQDIFK